MQALTAKQEQQAQAIVQAAFVDIQGISAEHLKCVFEAGKQLLAGASLYPTLIQLGICLASVSMASAEDAARIQNDIVDRFKCFEPLIASIRCLIDPDSFEPDDPGTQRRPCGGH